MHQDAHEAGGVGLKVGGEHASPSEFSATARLAWSNSGATAIFFFFSAMRCRSSATSSGPGCGNAAIGAASDAADG